ncbi:MAG: DUF1902 domain-containing protein [Rhodospirillaceae bacterium]|nr:DUF1902 domain-containing protein [Rhodospirillaceae bacterium]
MTGRTFTVNAAWDAEARVWTVSDSDVPGLAAEADTVERLQAKLRGLIPELLAENGVAAPEPVAFALVATSTTYVSRNAA